MSQKCIYHHEFKKVKDKESKKQMTWTAGKRKELTEKYAWAVPDDRVIQYIVDHSLDSKVYEIGAGNGYWSYEIQKRGGDIMPIDIEPPEDCWTDVYIGSYELLNPDNVDNVLLCWPPANHPMAANCVKHLDPNKVFFVGLENTTVTGDEEFHNIMNSEYNSESTYNIPNWNNKDNKFHMYRKKS